MRYKAEYLERGNIEFTIINSFDDLDVAKQAVRYHVAKLGLRCIFRWDSYHQFRCSEKADGIYGRVIDTQESKQPTPENIEKHVRQIMQRLIQARTTAGLTQSDAARMVGMSGASSLSQYESGRSTPNLTLFLQLCDAYNVSPIWALTGINPEFDATTWMIDFNEARNDAIESLRIASYLLAGFQTNGKRPAP